MDDIHVNFKTRMGSFSKFSDDIGIITYNGNTDITAIEMDFFCNKMYKVMDDNQFYLINSVKDIGSFSFEVWEFLGTNILHNNTIIASAVTSKSLGYTMQTKFYFKQFPLKYPVKLLENLEAAHSWIKELKTATKLK